MPALRIAVSVFIGIAALWFNFKAAIHVEETYATACLGRICPVIADDIYVLKVFAVLASLTLLVALNRALTWLAATTETR